MSSSAVARFTAADIQGTGFPGRVGAYSTVCFGVTVGDTNTRGAVLRCSAALEDFLSVFPLLAIDLIRGVARNVR